MVGRRYPAAPGYAALGKRLRWLRQRKGLSSPQVAEQAGVTGSAVLNWELAFTVIRPGELLRLCAVYGVPIEKMVEGIPVESFEAPAEVAEMRKRSGLKRSKTMAERGSTKARKARAKKKKGG